MIDNRFLSKTQYPSGTAFIWKSPRNKVFSPVFIEFHAAPATVLTMQRILFGIGLLSLSDYLLVVFLSSATFFSMRPYLWAFRVETFARTLVP